MSITTPPDSLSAHMNKGGSGVKAESPYGFGLTDERRDGRAVRTLVSLHFHLQPAEEGLGKKKTNQKAILHIQTAASAISHNTESQV